MKAKAAQRLAGMVDPVLTNMQHVATQKENLTAAVKAGSDLLNRAGIGEEIAAKVRSLKQREDSHRVVVNIGFLQQPTGEPTTIHIAAKNGEHEG